jgi:phosphonate transport system permease protein
MDGSASTDRRPDVDRLMRELDHRSRVERIRNVGIALAFVAVVYVTGRETEFSLGDLVRGLANTGRFADGFLHPHLDLLRPGSDGFAEGVIAHFVLQTLGIAVLGTAIGAVVAIPLSFVAARNLMRRNAVGSALYFVVRALMSVIRAIPTLFWGILFVASVSIGPFPGVLAVTLFSIGLMSKLFSEAIEAVDWGPIDALTATGATPLQVVVNAVLPQVTPYLVAHLLYTFEVNVHSATILGAVGAGGIGFLLIQYIEEFHYQDTAMVLLVAIAMTMVIDYSSAAIRRRII